MNNLNIFYQKFVAKMTNCNLYLWFQDMIITDYSGGSRISPGGGGANSPGGGRQHTILPNFPENCMKSKEFGRPGGGAPPEPPLNPPLD